jgi:CO/xanthine dehydrogenase FAD-binding subunit
MSCSLFLAPATLDEVLSVLADGAPLELLAGGTDLWPKWTAGLERPARVLSLHRLAALRGITHADGVLRVGATCTHTDLMRSPLVQQCCPALAEAAGTIGAIQIQNQGTIGGNLMNASPAADLPPPLVVAGARVELVSRQGTRLVPLDQFFLGYRRVDRRPDELMLSVMIPVLSSRSHEFFRKVGTRRAQAISKVVGSCRLTLAHDGTLRSIGLAFGSVAPTVIRLYDLERWLVGQRPTLELAQEAARRAEGAVNPIDDLRSSAVYRRHVLGRLVYQWISAAAALTALDTCV